MVTDATRDDDSFAIPAQPQHSIINSQLLQIHPSPLATTRPGPPADGLVPWRARTHMSLSFFPFERSLVNCETPAILSHFLQANDGGKIMIHLIWYIVVGL